MDDKELLKEFEKEFDKQDCYDYSCEARDCCNCRTFWNYFEEFKGENKRESN